MASDIMQADVQLRIRDEDFDNNPFLSVFKIRDISKLVGDEFARSSTRALLAALLKLQNPPNLRTKLS